MTSQTNTDAAIEMLTALCLFVTGLSHVCQPRAWADFFIQLRDRGAVGSLLTGLLHLPLGLVIVAFHNRWQGLPVVVTLIGWGLLLKSTLYMVYPAHGLRMLARVSRDRAWEFVVAGAFGIGLSGLIAYSVLRTGVL